MKTRLSEIIRQRGLDRKTIAKDLQIERRTLDNYVSEHTSMNGDIVKKMAEYLGVSTDYLLCVDELSDEFLNQKIENICNELKELVYHLNKRS